MHAHERVANSKRIARAVNSIDLSPSVLDKGAPGVQDDDGRAPTPAGPLPGLQGSAWNQGTAASTRPCPRTREELCLEPTEAAKGARFTASVEMEVQICMEASKVTSIMTDKGPQFSFKLNSALRPATLGRAAAPRVNSGNRSPFLRASADASADARSVLGMEPRKA